MYIYIYIYIIDAIVLYSDLRNIEVYKGKTGELLGTKGLIENSTKADIFQTPNKYLSLSIMENHQISEYDLNSLNKYSTKYDIR